VIRFLWLSIEAELGGGGRSVDIQIIHNPFFLPWYFFTEQFADFMRNVKKCAATTHHFLYLLRGSETHSFRTRVANIVFLWIQREGTSYVCVWYIHTIITYKITVIIYGSNISACCLINSLI
jgi:hypothetical protein